MFFVLTAIILFYFYFTSIRLKEWWRKKTLIDQLPGPKSYPLIGSLCKIAFVSRFKRIEEASKLCQMYGPLYRLWFTSVPVVNVLHPDDTEVILASSKNIDKGLLYEFFKCWLGGGLLTSAGQKWHHRRKMLTPAFHFSILETFFDTFVENSEILVQTLEKSIGSNVDMFPYISKCTLDIICESAMGVKMNTQSGESTEYLESVKEITQLVIDRILSPWHYTKFIYKRTSQYQKLKKALSVLHGMSMKVINQRRQQRKEQQFKHVKDSYVGEKRRRAFLDSLLDIEEESEDQFTLRDIRDEVDTFMFEGHDTTSAALVYAIYLLGRHPKIQDTLYEELLSVFGPIDTKPTMKEISELKYLDAVIKETLRLFPSVPFIGRVLTEAVKLRGYEIPAGTTILVHLYFLHRQQEFFPNPNEFDPSNFLAKRNRKRHPFAYAPFSAGPRNCIGQKFAMLEMKVVLSTFFRKYKIESLQELHLLGIIPDSILRPSNGVRVRIEKRTQAS